MSIKLTPIESMRRQVTLGLTEMSRLYTTHGHFLWRISCTREELQCLRKALDALPPPELCEDEGCPQHGTPHVCVTSEQALSQRVPEGWSIEPRSTGTAYGRIDGFYVSNGVSSQIVWQGGVMYRLLSMLTASPAPADSELARMRERVKVLEGIASGKDMLELLTNISCGISSPADSSMATRLLNRIEAARLRGGSDE